MSRPPSQTPEAVSMRRLRAERAAELGPKDPASHIYLVRRPGRPALVEGRVQIDGRRLVIARSTAKHGGDAFRIVQRQVELWLAEGAAA